MDTKEKEDNQFDIIIIGAGIGALTAGALRARKENKRVLVLEKQSALGGYATLFSREGTTFDVSLHQIGGLTSTRMAQILKEAGVYDLVTLLPSPTLSDIEIEGELVSIPSGNMKAFEQSLLARFPDERLAIRLWFWIMRRFGRQVAYMDKSKTNNPLIQAIICYLAPLFAPFLVISLFWVPRLSLALRVKSPQLKTILTHFSGYYGLPASQINILFPMVANYGYYKDGGFYIKGGGFRLAMALAKVIKSKGGELRTQSQVKQILVRNNKAYGVVVTNKKTGEDEHYFADDIVCGANPYSVYQELVPPSPLQSRMLDRLRRLRPSMSASVLYLKVGKALKDLPEKIGCHYEYGLFPKGDETDVFEFALGRSDFSEGYNKLPLLITTHAVLDPSPAEMAGTETRLNIFFPDNYDRWAALSPQAYKEQKAIEIRRILDRLDHQFPGLSNSVTLAELGTPLTMERYTSNYKGAIYGFDQAPDQALFRRFSIKSPIKNLFFVSAWSVPGGGYEGSIRAADSYAHPLTWKMKLIFITLVLVPSLGVRLYEWLAGFL